MPLNGFYFVHGDDSDMIEKKWLPDVSSRYTTQTWVRLDATIDDIDVGALTTEYYTNNLFGDGKVLFVRNADYKHAQVAELIKQLVEKPVPGNALILVANSPLPCRQALGRLGLPRSTYYYWLRRQQDKRLDDKRSGSETPWNKLRPEEEAIILAWARASPCRLGSFFSRIRLFS